MAFRRLKKTRIAYWTYNARTDVFYDIGLCVIARPAPRTARPLASVPNPYPYGCSVLCNHPKDPELKDVVWKPRPMAHEQGDEHKKKSTRSSGDNESFLFHHNWDETLINNRDEESTTTNQAAAKLAQIRRCTSSGPINASERRLSKADSMLVLDLRPWKSFDNVSSVTDATQQDNADHLEVKKPLRRSASSKSKEIRAPPKNTIPDANLVSDYEEDNLVQDVMVNHQVDDTIRSQTETLEEKDTNKEVEEKYAVQQNDTAEDIAHQIEELEENLGNIKVDDIAEERQQHEVVDPYPDPYHDTDWLNFPRAGQTFGARFELPIDLRKLKNMTPVEYLGLHVVSTRCRQRLNDVVYERHAKGSFLPSEGLHSAVAEVLGFRLDNQAETQLIELIRLEHDVQLNRDQFAGIGALAERIARADISERDDLEISDFNLLATKLHYLEMSDELRTLFLFIGRGRDD